jgi:Bacteriocin-protection, YdeI or OmpD-Associated/Domain of unknown function (DUF1905)
MEFDAIVEGAADGGNQWIPLPFDPKAAFGKARAPVVVSVADHPAFPTTIAIYGGVAIIGLRKAQSAAFGLAIGDTVRVQIALDTEPRTVDVPADLADALAAAPQAAAAYERLSYTHRREYVRWITSAKRAQTRQARVARAVEMLSAGVRTPD